ncbi:universal stress protein [Yinghuangia aomiensis]|uniref:Universal stress protein n=1 Tax=Yinghuangia aomiensis TaxID=676205 RepID=A0ABP9H4C9_9ACTN
MSEVPGNAPVVVGLDDDGEAGRRAVRWAAHEAALRGRPLHIVHALDWPPVVDPDPAHATPWEEWRARFRDDGRRLLDGARELASAAEPGLAVTGALVDGKPKTVLTKATAGAALVVLGSRRLSSLQEALTTGGGVAVPVIAHARCPVAVVRRSGPDRNGAGPVVVGSDGSPGSERAMAYAFEAAVAHGAEVLVVRVCHMPMTVAGAVAAEAAMRDALAALEHELARWAEKYPDVMARGEAGFGHPVRVLADVSGDALCLVVGTRGLEGFRGMLLGSVGGGLVHHAECPLVVVPGDRDQA